MAPRQRTYVALLRGVNVGGRNRLAMSDLRAVVESSGQRDVRTYINSGNVVFRGALNEARLVSDLRAAIAERLGRDVEVMVRGRDELATIVAGVPFDGSDPKRLIIAFLAEPPAPAATHALESVDAAPERVAVVGRVAYLSLPNGLGRSILAPLVERRLMVRSTARNLATVRALLALCDEVEDGPAG